MRPRRLSLAASEAALDAKADVLAPRRPSVLSWVLRSRQLTSKLAQKHHSYLLSLSRTGLMRPIGLSRAASEAALDAKIDVLAPRGLGEWGTGLALGCMNAPSCAECAFSMVEPCTGCMLSGEESCLCAAEIGGLGCANAPSCAEWAFFVWDPCRQLACLQQSSTPSRSGTH